MTAQDLRNIAEAAVIVCQQREAAFLKSLLDALDELNREKALSLVKRRLNEIQSEVNP